MGIEIATGRLLAIDISDRPYLDFYFDCEILSGVFRPSSEVAQWGFFGLDETPPGTSAHYLKILREIDDNTHHHSVWPIFVPPIEVDNTEVTSYSDDIKREEHHPSFEFVPYEKQEGVNKEHIIRLAISFPSPPPEERAAHDVVAQCCNTSLRRAVTDLRIRWGDEERLVCVVQNTPVLQCGCRTLVEPWSAIAIKERTRAIRDAFEFQTDERFRDLAKFLSPTDVAKVRDFAAVVRHDRTRTTDPHPSMVRPRTP